MNANPNESGTFQTPAAAETEEEASQEFVPPPEGGETTEAASVSASAEALSGVPAELLAIKSAIEDKLRQSAVQSAGTTAAVSFDAVSGAKNIQGVAIGLGDTPSQIASSSEPGAPALTVYVAEPASVDEVKSAVVDSMGIQAASDDNVPINVVVTGLIDAQPHRWRERPAPGGISVAHYKVTAGTIGCLCIGRTPPRNQRLMVLSNNHVLANSNSAVFGDCICQPGPYDGGKCPQDQIAILERFVPINFAGGTNYVDCATGWCWPDRVRRDLVYVSGGNRYYFRISNVPKAPFLGMIVGKSGRTTQLKVGRVAGIGATIRVNYGGGKVALMADQIEVRAYYSGDTFSAGGDSGSSIWEWTSARNPVGLLFAGGGASTFANRITRVIAALDINLYT